MVGDRLRSGKECRHFLWRLQKSKRRKKTREPFLEGGKKSDNGEGNGSDDLFLAGQ